MAATTWAMERMEQEDDDGAVKVKGQHVTRGAPGWRPDEKKGKGRPQDSGKANANAPRSCASWNWNWSLAAFQQRECYAEKSKGQVHFPPGSIMLAASC